MDQFVVFMFYIFVLSVRYPDTMSALFGLLLLKVAFSWLRSRRY